MRRRSSSVPLSTASITRSIAATFLLPFSSGTARHASMERGSFCFCDDDSCVCDCGCDGDCVCDGDCDGDCVSNDFCIPFKCWTGLGGCRACSCDDFSTVSRQSAGCTQSSRSMWRKLSVTCASLRLSSPHRAHSPPLQTSVCF